MTPAGPRPSAPAPPAPVDRRAVVAGAIVLLGFALVAVSLVGLVLLGRDDAAALRGRRADPAPPLELTDQDGRRSRLASLAGRPVLVFFGYTHCPDVCPESIGLHRPGARGQPGRRAGGVRVDRPRARRRRRHEGLPAVPAGGVHGPDRRARRGRRERRRAGRCGTRRRRRSPAPARTACRTRPTSSWSTARAGCGPRSRTGRRSSRSKAWLTRLAGRADPRRPMPAAPSAAPSSAAGRREASRAAVAATTAPMPMGDLRATVVSTSVWAGGHEPGHPVARRRDGHAARRIGAGLRAGGRGGRRAGRGRRRGGRRAAGGRVAGVLRRHGRHPQPGSWRLDRDRRDLGGQVDDRRARPGCHGAARWPGAGRRHADARRRRRQVCSRSPPSRSRTCGSTDVDGRRPGRRPALRDRRSTRPGSRCRRRAAARSRWSR